MFRVLVVDDILLNLKVAEKLLKSLGHEVEVELCPLTSLERNDLDDFDLFLIDIEMPEMTGFVLREKLAALPQVKGKFIAYTAHEGYGAAPEYYNAGFHGFLAKPCSKRAMSGVLNSSFCAETCIGCQIVITAGIGFYNSPEGPYCCPCADIQDTIQRLAKAEKKDRFRKFLKSDQNISLFVNYED